MPRTVNGWRQRCGTSCLKSGTVQKGYVWNWQDFGSNTNVSRMNTNVSRTNTVSPNWLPAMRSGRLRRWRRNWLSGMPGRASHRYSRSRGHVD